MRGHPVSIPGQETFFSHVQLPQPYAPALKGNSKDQEKNGGHTF